MDGNDGLSSSCYLSSLPEPLREYALRALSPPRNHDDNDNIMKGDDNDGRGGPVNDVTTNNASASSTTLSLLTKSNDSLDEFELSARSHLLVLTEKLLLSSSREGSEKEKGDYDTIFDQLLQYLKNVTLLCLHVVKKHHHSSNTHDDKNNDSYSHLSTTLPLKKLPFLLIEDAFDTLPLSIIQTLWSSTQHPNLNLSSYATTSILCSPLIFALPSKFVLLRICNKLLKQLSHTPKATDVEFAGSVLILLAKVFPLSERSAVNVLGSYNIRKSSTSTTEESSVCNGTGNTTANSGELPLDSEAKTEGLVGEETYGNAIGNEFYKIFWGVQKVFTDPLGTIIPSQRGGSSTASGEAGGGIGLSQVAAADAYQSFINDITSILMALESTPIPKVTKTAVTIISATDHDHEDDDENDNNDTKAPSFQHHRYLTSHQLLHLQLKDVQLRVHFLTQLLIVLSHLASPNVALPVPPSARDGTKVAVQVRVAEQTRQLSQLEKRAMELLHATVALSPSSLSSPPSADTEPLCRFLSWILKDRESMWRAWKRAKCMPALDKIGNITVSGSDIYDALKGEKKRKAETAALDESSDRRVTSTEELESMTEISFLRNDGTGEVAETPLPSLESFLNPYVEALDPENGIEGEYHPRNDKVYCWRALRLMARDQNYQGQLCRFHKLRRRDGDFEGIVRDMWKVDKQGEEIGGDMIEEEYYANEIDLDDTPHEASYGVDFGENDVNMLDDAASVGSPEEDIEARKEKMAEFERAAMEVEENLLKDDTIENTEAEESKKIVAANGDTVVNKDDNVSVPIIVSKNAPTQVVTKHHEEGEKEIIESNKVKSTMVTATPPVDKHSSEDKKSLSSNGVTTVTISSAKNNGKGQTSSTRDNQRQADEPKGEEIKTSAPTRPKFTPPQKKNPPQPSQPLNNESNRDGSRGRFVRKNNSTDQVSQQQSQPQLQPQPHQSRIPPPQNHNQRSSGRDGGNSKPTQQHLRSNSMNDDSQEATQRRDGKSQPPALNKTNNETSMPRGGGVSGKGKGGWEPPPSQGGSGRGGGEGSNYRERRHGGGSRR